MDNYEDENKALLERFATALKEGDVTADFDVEELLDISHFAGDYGMDYLRAEALFWGAAHYPGNKELLERRAVFYSDVLGPAAVNSFNADHSADSTLLSRILDARANILDRENALKFIRQTVSENSDIGDEEIIQLVNYAADTDNLQWMADNIETVYASLAYRPAFLYELSASAMDQGKYQMALRPLDDLVTEMPYNAEYWSLISTAHLNLGNMKEAYDAAEMALAIDPKYPEALVSKARYLKQKGDLKELEAMAKENPDSMAILESYVDVAYPRSFSDENVRETLLNIVTEAVGRFPESLSLQSAFVILSPAGLAMDAYLDELWGMSDNSTQMLPDKVRMWTSWARSVYFHNSLEGTCSILNAIYRNISGDADNIQAWDIVPVITLAAVVHLHLKHFDNVIEDVDMVRQICGDVSPTLHVVYVVALICLSRFEEARNYVDEFLQKRIPSTDMEKMGFMGVEDHATMVITLRWTIVFFETLKFTLQPKNVKNFDLEHFDPLLFWQDND